MLILDKLRTEGVLDYWRQGIRIKWFAPRHKSMSGIVFEAAYWEFYSREQITPELYSKIKEYGNETTI